MKAELTKQRVEAINWTVQLLSDLISDESYLDNDPEFMQYLVEQLTAVADELQPKSRKNARRANVELTYGTIETRQNEEHGSWKFSTVAEAAEWLAAKTCTDKRVCRAAIYNMLKCRINHYKGYTVSV